MKYSYLLAWFSILFGKAAAYCDYNDGWELYNGKCYKRSGSPVTFVGAMSNCEDLGGTLVSIADEEENNFVRELIGYFSNSDFVWLGMGADTPETSDDWVWLDGTESTWHKFLDGEPNSLFQTSPNRIFSCDCYIMNHEGNWEDRPCSFGGYAVCTKEPEIGQLLVINPFSDRLFILQGQSNRFVIKTYPKQAGIEIQMDFSFPNVAGDEVATSPTCLIAETDFGINCPESYNEDESNIADCVEVGSELEWYNIMGPNIATSNEYGEVWVEILCEEHNEPWLNIFVTAGGDENLDYITLGSSQYFSMYYGLMESNVVYYSEAPDELNENKYYMEVELNLMSVPPDGSQLTTAVQPQYTDVCILAPGGTQPWDWESTDGPMNIEFSGGNPVIVSLVCDEFYELLDCGTDNCLAFPDPCFEAPLCCFAGDDENDYSQCPVEMQDDCVPTTCTTGIWTVDQSTCVDDSGATNAAYCQGACIIPGYCGTPSPDQFGAIYIFDQDFGNVETGAAQVDVERTVDIQLVPLESYSLSEDVVLSVSIGQSSNCILSWEGSSSTEAIPLTVTFQPSTSTTETITILCSQPYSGELNKLDVTQVDTNGEEYNEEVAALRTSLIVFDRPEPPQRVSSISIDEGEGIVTFTPPEDDNNAPITEYTVYWERVGAVDEEYDQSGNIAASAVTVCDVAPSPYTGTACTIRIMDVLDDEIIGVLDDDAMYSIEVTATNRAGESDPSEKVMVKEKPDLPDPDFGCPIDSEDVFGPVTVFTTENDAGQEQLSVIVSWFLPYNAPIDCDTYCIQDGELEQVEFEFGDRSCNDECVIFNPDYYTNVECADVFDVDFTCPDWAFARMDLVMSDNLNENGDICGFDVIEDELYLYYTINLISTATLESESIFGDAPLRSETIIRQITIKWPKRLVETLEPIIYGQPIREIFPVSVIDKVNQVHSLEVTTRTQYPYIITGAEISVVGTNNMHTMTIGDETCENHEDGMACEQLLTIQTGEDSFGFPDCDTDLNFQIDLTMECSDPQFECDVPIEGGCTFHVSTDFCPDLSIEAQNVGAELLSFRTVQNDGNFPYTLESDEQSAFAYLNTIYYEMSISGLTAADVEIESFKVEKMVGNEPYPFFDFAIFGVSDDDPTADYYDYQGTAGGYTTPTIKILKEFDEQTSANMDSIIFKHVVNEFTFPEYPDDETNPLENYRVTCVVVNNGFRRSLQAVASVGGGRRLTNEQYGDVKIVGIGVKPNSDGSSASVVDEVNDGAEPSSSAAHIFFSKFLLVSSLLGMAIAIL